MAMLFASTELQTKYYCDKEKGPHGAQTAEAKHDEHWIPSTSI